VRGSSCQSASRNRLQIRLNALPQAEPMKSSGMKIPALTDIPNATHSMIKWHSPATIHVEMENASGSSSVKSNVIPLAPSGFRSNVASSLYSPSSQLNCLKYEGPRRFPSISPHLVSKLGNIHIVVAHTVEMINTSSPFFVVPRDSLARNIASFRFAEQNKPPTTPPPAPTKANRKYSHKSKSGWALSSIARLDFFSPPTPLNIAMLLTWKPSSSASSIFVSIANMEMTVTHADRKQRQVSTVDQNELPSSIANSTPATGDRKAAAVYWKSLLLVIYLQEVFHIIRGELTYSSCTTNGREINPCSIGSKQVVL